MRHSLVFPLLLVTIAGSPVDAQQQAPTEFDVASVKMLKQPKPPHGVGLIWNHGTLTVDAAQLRQIIGLAFTVQRVLVNGCPDWCDDDQFDITAKSSDTTATRDQMKVMLQNTLKERFGLVVHRETKAVPGFELITAKAGSRIEASKDEPGPVDVFTQTENGMTFHNMSTTGLINYLANILRQPVKDVTGLTGRHNFALEFKPLDSGATADDFPSIVMAAVEELGLKLVPKRVPTDILVVDHVQHPSEN